MCNSSVRIVGNILKLVSDRTRFGSGSNWMTIENERVTSSECLFLNFNFVKNNPKVLTGAGDRKFSPTLHSAFFEFIKYNGPHTQL